MGFIGWLIKWIFIIAFWLGVIVIGLITLGIMLDSPNPWVAGPAAIIAFIFIIVVVGWKVWLVAYVIFKGDEILNSEVIEEESESEPKVAKNVHQSGLRWSMTPEKVEKLRQIDDLQKRLDTLYAKEKKKIDALREKTYHE